MMRLEGLADQITRARTALHRLSLSLPEFNEEGIHGQIEPDTLDFRIGRNDMATDANGNILIESTAVPKLVAYLIGVYGYDPGGMPPSLEKGTGDAQATSLPE